MAYRLQHSGRCHGSTAYDVLVIGLWPTDGAIVAWNILAQGYWPVGLGAYRSGAGLWVCGAGRIQVESLPGDGITDAAETQKQLDARVLVLELDKRAREVFEVVLL